MNLQVFKEDKSVTSAIAEHIAGIITELGEDVNRQGLQRTPERVGEAFQYLTKGYKEDPDAILRSALFEDDYRHMVVVKDIDFYSLCEHHLLPFFGKVHIAYIPNGKRVTGLSKIARVVDVYARRLQIQERMTTQIKDCIQRTLEAEHLCMKMRGTEKQNSITTTSDFTGAFTRAETRNEFLRLIH